MQVALQQSATDPNTGTIDMECITTGMTSTDRRAREQLANELRELLKSKCPSADIACMLGVHSSQTQKCSMSLKYDAYARSASSNPILNLGQHNTVSSPSQSFE